MFGLKTTGKELLMILFLIYIGIDLVIFIYNVLMNKGPGGCATENWISGLFFINNRNQPSLCGTIGGARNNPRTLGRYSEYAREGESCLYENEINTLVADTKSGNTIEGYTSTQLIAYVIIPVVIIEAIGFWLISTRANKAEWTFWILIITIIYTGLSTLVERLAIDDELDITRETTSCMNYITDVLDTQNNDEIQYSFMVRRADGESCLIEGTKLDTGSGLIDDSTDTSYSGSINTCNKDDLPIY